MESPSIRRHRKASSGRPRNVLAIVAVMAALSLTPHPASGVGEESGALAEAAGAQGGGVNALPEKLTGDELLLFDELPQVISGARMVQPMNQSSVPISILSADDIHYSGLTNIAEMLQFVPGMEVLRVTQNRYAIGVRGLASSINDRILTLINGRNASNPAFSGTDLLTLPVLMEDIERIEVVRGAGGAAWGANAHNGVINIITKDPRDVIGLFVSSTLNDRGHTYSQLRYGHADEKLAWRFSGGWEDADSSDQTLDSVLAPFPSDVFESHDFRRSARFDAEAVYNASADTTLRSGVAYSVTERGDFEFIDRYTGKNDRVQECRLFARVDRTFEDGAAGYLQWFANISDADQNTDANYTTIETDLEAQYSFAASAAHRVTAGGNIRFAHIDTHENDAQDFTFEGNPFSEHWIGVFVIDRWDVTDHLALEGQLRLDSYSETGLDWSGRATALYAVDHRDGHILRLSAARAFRSPLLLYRELALTRTEIAPGVFANNLVSNENAKNESAWSIESGYTGRLSESLTVRVDGYMQWYEQMLGVRYDLAAPLGTPNIFVDNAGDGVAWGGEAELTYRGDGWSASAWYAYNDFQPEFNHQEIRAFQPARHKVGMTGRIQLPHDMTLNCNYRFTNTTPPSPAGTVSVAVSHRLDVTVTRKLARGRGELAVGLLDALNTDANAVSDIGMFSRQETPGRTFFARLQWSF